MNAADVIVWRMYMTLHLMEKLRMPVEYLFGEDKESA